MIRSLLAIAVIHVFVLTEVAAQVAFVAPQQASDEITQGCIEAFKILAAAQPDDAWIATSNGEGLAWGESYRLLAYVAMFEGTGELSYLETAMRRIDQVLKIRDDRRNLKDEVRGKVMPAWSCSTFTDGKPYAWLVHAGMITYPVARCAYLVRRDPELRSRYVEKADAYVAAIEETVHAFDDEWQDGPGPNEGYYHGDLGTKGVLPFNQQNALGRTLVSLWLATGKAEYKAKAEKLACYFKNRLRLDGNRYVWSYHPNSAKSEDLSHAAINVDFAFVCYRAGLVFTRDDMLRFAATLKACAREDRGFTMSIDGSGDISDVHSLAVGRWGHLGFVDRDLRTALYNYLQKNWSKSPAVGMLGAAYLVETERELVFDAAPATRPDSAPRSRVSR